MREVCIRPRAQLDIESAYIYRAVELKAPQAAQTLVDELYDTFDLLAELPEIGMRFSDDSLERDYRRKLVGKHWVYYTFDDTQLVIWRIFHVRQDVDNYSLVDW